MGKVYSWPLSPLGGGVPQFPPRVPAYTGEGLDPLGSYIHEDLAPEILLPQEVVFPKQDIARAYRLAKNLTNEDLLALVAVASQVASSQTGCHLTTKEHTLRLHHWLGVRKSVWTLLQSFFVGASEETWNTLVPPSPTYLWIRDIEGSGEPTPLFSLLLPQPMCKFLGLCFLAGQPPTLSYARVVGEVSL
ncbi:hypothetical protein DSO57_1023882 [Entomophthora muscae]|uniref:Uncharacterized protein n=1 Tax=Entomophthora muscae TaxID=34485 RepID=A0ACC2TQ96_9FUNG|nr:hypothetical protein DSO57_1023882 [Entomophthora muscae]